MSEKNSIGINVSVFDGRYGTENIVANTGSIGNFIAMKYELKEARWSTN